MAETESVLTEEETLLEIAKIAEMAEMHACMAEKMKELVSKGKRLEKNARNLLSVAYKNLVGSKRSSWRVVRSILDKLEKDLEEETTSEGKARLAKRKKITEDFLTGIVQDLRSICTEVVSLLDDNLISVAEDTEEKTFFHKMKGDYYRYLSEVLKDVDKNEFDEVCKKSLDAYKEASENGTDLPPTNPVLLGNKLNFSVFYYEIMNNPSEACKLAKEAFDQAIGELDGLQEESYKDSTLIMQLLRDNLTLWTAEVSEEGGKDED